GIGIPLRLDVKVSMQLSNGLRRACRSRRIQQVGEVLRAGRSRDLRVRGWVVLDRDESDTGAGQTRHAITQLAGGEDRRKAGILNHQPEPLNGVLRVEWHVRSAGRKDTKDSRCDMVIVRYHHAYGEIWVGAGVRDEPG